MCNKVIELLFPTFVFGLFKNVLKMAKIKPQLTLTGLFLFCLALLKISKFQKTKNKGNLLY